MPVIAIESHRKALFFTIIATLISLLSIWGCSSDSSDAASSGDGSIALRVQLNGGTQKSAGEKASQLSCTDLNLGTIQARVYDQKGGLVADSALWPCEEHSGTLDKVKAGDNYTVVLLGRASDQESDPVIIYGHRPEVAVRKGELSSVDVVAQSFAPKQTGSSGICRYIVLEWEAVPGAQNYEVSISANSDMSNPATHTTAEPRFEPSGLDNGIAYYWQVRALDAYGNAGLNSDAGHFAPVGSRLVKDFSAGSLGSDPTGMVLINDNLYFSAHDETGRYLWKYDGTQTRKIVFGQSKHNYIRGIVEFKESVYFGAYDGADYELWTVEDDTAYEIDIHSTGTSGPRNLTVYDDHLYFTAIDKDGEAHHRELYKFDGSNWSEIGIGQQVAGGISDLTVAGNALYFIASGTDGEPFKWDGQTLTALGTNPQLGNSGVRRFTVVNDQIYYSAYDDATHRMLFMCDDQTEQPIKIGGYTDSSSEYIAGMDGAVYFSARSAEGNRDLFKYSGSGTEAENLNINASGCSLPQDLISIDGKLYFTAENEDIGREPYFYSDGRLELIEDIQSGHSGSGARKFTGMMDRVYFTAGRSPQYGWELWNALKTNHETSVADICPGSCSSSPSSLTQVDFNGEPTLFFSADDGHHGRELWAVTGSGTPRLIDINKAVGGVCPYGLTEVNGKFYFGADDGENGIELWESDGTAEGTIMAADINPDGDSRPGNITGLNGKVYFTAVESGADQYNRSYELYEYNGKDASKIEIGGDGANSCRQLMAAGGNLYVDVIDPSKDSGLWRYDGVNEPERINLRGLPEIYYASRLTDADGMLYFTAREPSSQSGDLYKYNGRISTWIDFNESALTISHPNSLTAVGKDLFFVAEDQDEQSHLYRYDGTTVIPIQTNQNGGSVPRSLTASGGKLYFTASDGSQRSPYVYGNGSLGKIEIDSGSDHNTGRFFSVGDILYFIVSAKEGDNATTTVQLWKTSGTSLVAEKVKDLRIGLHGNVQYDLKSVVALNGRAYFGLTAWDVKLDPLRRNPLEAAIWETGGTAQNTTLIFEVDDYRMPGFVPELIKKDDKLYYIFYDARYGPGLWQYCPEALQSSGLAQK